MATARSIPELVRLQATALGEKPFLQVWAESEGIVLTLSFAGFAARVRCAEAALRGLGVAPGERVGMLSHPSVQFFAYALGALGCGATCVALNWRQPQLAAERTGALSGLQLGTAEEDSDHLGSSSAHFAMMPGA